MSDTQQRLIGEGDVEDALKELSYISPGASEHSMILVDKDIEVPLRQFGEKDSSATLNLCGAIVEVTHIDKRGNPSLFNVYKGAGSAPLAAVKVAKPAGYPYKLEYSNAALQHGVVTIKEKASSAAP